jgi:hypothetical protein
MVIFSTPLKIDVIEFERPDARAGPPSRVGSSHCFQRVLQAEHFDALITGSAASNSGACAISA